MPPPDTIDKRTWGDGPWQDEPDYLHWEDGAFHCAIVRHPEMGHLCGYVALPDDHRDTRATSYDKIDAHVHGGLTFLHNTGEAWVRDQFPDFPTWRTVVGFDCAHAGDLMPAMAARFGVRSDDTYRTVDYVRGELRDLVAQLR